MAIDNFKFVCFVQIYKFFFFSLDMFQHTIELNFFQQKAEAGSLALKAIGMYEQKIDKGEETCRKGSKVYSISFFQETFFTQLMQLFDLALAMPRLESKDYK